MRCRKCTTYNEFTCKISAVGLVDSQTLRYSCNRMSRPVYERRYVLERTKHRLLTVGHIVSLALQ